MIKILNKLIENRIDSLMREKLDAIINSEIEKSREKTRDSIILFYEHLNNAFRIRHRGVIERLVKRETKLRDDLKSILLKDGELSGIVKSFLAKRELEQRNYLERYINNFIDGEECIDTIVDRILKKQLK